MVGFKEITTVFKLKSRESSFLNGKAFTYILKQSYLIWLGNSRHAGTWMTLPDQDPNMQTGAYIKQLGCWVSNYTHSTQMMGNEIQMQFSHCDLHQQCTVQMTVCLAICLTMQMGMHAGKPQPSAIQDCCMQLSFVLLVTRNILLLITISR